MPRVSHDECGGSNGAAFLDMIAFSELGARMLADPASDDGYRIIVGSTPGNLIIFNDYARHPNRLITLPNLNIKSTAAGRYQVLNRYAVIYMKQLNLPDFSPESQDRIALQQMKERGAFNMLKQGRLATAMRQCSNIWASLPGAGYGQHENKIENLVLAYKRAGGEVALA